MLALVAPSVELGVPVRLNMILGLASGVSIYSKV